MTQDGIWQAWVGTTATTIPVYCSTNATTAAVWVNWNQSYSTTPVSSVSYVMTPGWETWNSTWEETREQKQAREAREAESRVRAAAAQAERAAARKRSEELLEFVLTGEQMADYRERGYFEVISSKGRRWRIRARGQAGNVDLLPEQGSERDATYCIHPRGVPDPDAHLAQALMLATDEDEFLRVANRQWVRLAA